MRRFVSARLLRRRVAPHLAPLALTAALIAALVAGTGVLPRALTVARDEQFAVAVDPNRSSAAELVLSARWSEPDGGDRIARVLSSATNDLPSGLREPLAGAVGEPGWNIALAAVPIDQPRPGGGDPVELRLVVDADALATGQTLQGAAPTAWTGTGPIEIALAEGVAERLGAAVGDVFTSDGLEMRVAEIVVHAPVDAVVSRHREVFEDVVEERLQNGTSLLSGGALIDPAGLDALDGYVYEADLTGWYAVSAGALSASDSDALASAIRLATSAGATFPSGEPVTVSSRLSPILERVVVTSTNAAALAWLLAAGVLGAIVVAAGNAARGYADRRAVARALMAARGAGLVRTIRDGALETAIAAIPGAIVGAFVAVAVVPGPVGPADIGVPVAVAAIVIVWGAVLAAPLPSAWRRPVRVGVDLVLVALGVGGAALLAARGFAPEGTAPDPFLVSAPFWIAVAAGMCAARLLPLALRGVERVGRVRASAAARVATAWASRRPAAVAPLVAIVVAFSACVSSLVVGQSLADAFTVAARDAVGADARIVSADGAPPSLDAVRAVAGVADAVEVRVARGIGLTEDGRSRPVEVLVADTAALHALRPDLPELGQGEIAVGEELADAVEGTVELGDDIPVEPTVVQATLPVGSDGRWVLVDERTLAATELSGPVWILCRWVPDPPADAPAALRAAAGSDATVMIVSEVRAEAEARPSAVVLTGVLLAGVLVPLLLAALALAAAVVAIGPERERLRAVLRLLGLPRRGNLLPVLWQVVPTVIGGTLAGTAIGIGVSALVAAVSDVAGVAGVTGITEGPAFPVGAVLSAAAVGAVFLILAGLLAALPALRRARRAPDRNGAA